jgi:hypothetical protein
MEDERGTGALLGLTKKEFFIKFQKTTGSVQLRDVLPANFLLFGFHIKDNLKFK